MTYRLTENEALQHTYKYIRNRTWALDADDWAALKEQEELAARENERSENA